jgi:hypothetical protein
LDYFNQHESSDFSPVGNFYAIDESCTACKSSDLDFLGKTLDLAEAYYLKRELLDIKERFKRELKEKHSDMNSENDKELTYDELVKYPPSIKMDLASLRIQRDEVNAELIELIQAYSEKRGKELGFLSKSFSMERDWMKLDDLTKNKLIDLQRPLMYQVEHTITDREFIDFVNKMDSTTAKQYPYIDYKSKIFDWAKNIESEIKYNTEALYYFKRYIKTIEKINALDMMIKNGDTNALRTLARIKKCEDTILQ